MIRELINFMNDLMSDIPDIMEWKSQPDNCGIGIASTPTTSKAT